VPAPSREGSKPKKRRASLLVTELSDEVLVYDLDRHRALCLGKNISWIWQHCSGLRTVAELARALQEKIGRPVSEDIVRVALHRLGRARLLQERPEAPPRNAARSRRELLGKAALLGGFSLMSIVVPTPAFAASCIPKHGPCDPAGPNRCCRNCFCNPGRKCVGSC
jgi:hypothetical protein